MDIAANSPNTAQVSDTQLTKLGDKDANTLIGGPLGSLVTPKDAPAQMLVLGPPTSDATEMQTIVQAVRDEAALVDHRQRGNQQRCLSGRVAAASAGAGEGSGHSVQRQVLRDPRSP